MTRNLAKPIWRGDLGPSGNRPFWVALWGPPHDDNLDPRFSDFGSILGHFWGGRFWLPPDFGVGSDFGGEVKIW